MLTYSDRAVSFGSSVAVVSCISALFCKYPESFTVQLSDALMRSLNYLTIFSLHENTLHVVTWTIFLFLSVTVFGIFYLAGALSVGAQKIDTVHVITIIVILAAAVGVLVSFPENNMFYAEVYFVLLSIALSCFLVSKRRYENEYFHYTLLYILTVLFISVGVSFNSISFFDLMYVVLVTTGVYTTLFWVISMLLIFVRECVSL